MNCHIVHFGNKHYKNYILAAQQLFTCATPMSRQRNMESFSDKKQYQTCEGLGVKLSSHNEYIHYAIIISCWPENMVIVVARGSCRVPRSANFKYYLPHHNLKVIHMIFSSSYIDQHMFQFFLLFQDKKYCFKRCLEQHIKYHYLCKPSIFCMFPRYT